MKNIIVWSSGLNIWDESFLSTLCVFYDEVLLPAVTDVDELCVFEKSADTDYKIASVAAMLHLNHEGEKKSAGELHNTWERKNKVLYDENVIKRLPSPIGVDGPSLLNESLYDDLKDILLDIPYSIRSEGTSGNRLFLWKDHILHLLRNDLSHPNLFVAQQQKTNREVLKSLIALKSFNYLLPKLSKLHPDQILEVRKEVASNREGFSLHLQTLSYEVETRIKEGDSIKEIQQYANSVAETKLIPDYLGLAQKLNNILR